MTVPRGVLDAIRDRLSPPALPAGMEAVLRAETLAQERRASAIRFWMSASCVLALVPLWSTNTERASWAFVGVGATYAVWAAFAWWRASRGRPVSALLHAVLDPSLVTLGSLVGVLNWSGGYETLLAPLFPLLYLLWISLSALHAAVLPAVMAGVVAAVMRAGVLLWLTSGGYVEVAARASYGEGAVGMEDQWTIVGVLALAGVVSGWLAWSSRQLLVRAAADRVHKDALLQAEVDNQTSVAMLASSESMFRVAFEHAPWGMALLTPDMRVLRVNRSLSEQLGWLPEELVGRGLREIVIRGADLDIAQGRDLLCQRRDGSQVAFRASMALAVDDSGRPLHVTAQFLALPQGGASETERVGARPEGQDVVARATAVADPSLDGVCALVVEDDEDMLTWMLGALRRAGATVHGAASVAMARSVLDAHRFDVVVADVRLPDGDGAAMLDEACTRVPSMGALLISGQADDDEVAPNLRRLRKPFRAEVLVRAVAERHARRIALEPALPPR